MFTCLVLLPVLCFLVHTRLQMDRAGSAVKMLQASGALLPITPSERTSRPWTEGATSALALR